MPRATAVLFGILIAAFLVVPSGCVSCKPGDTVYRVKVDDEEEAKLVRLKMWRVARAVEIVSVRYGLTDITVEVIIEDLGGLGETQPTLTPAAEVDGAKMFINKRLFVEGHPDLDDILLGLVAHELAHAMHYSRMSTRDLATLGIRYDRAMKNPDGPQVEWVRSYERLTDMTAIALGFGPELVHQKRASEQNLAENDPEHVWDFYLKEDEIVELTNDRERLRASIQEELDVLKLPSLSRLPEHLKFDQDGDVVPRSVR